MVRPDDSGKPTVQKGTVDIHRARCKGCTFCVTYCPTGAIEMSDELNEKGYRLPVLIRPHLCNGCNLCGRYCPDFAIVGRKVGRKSGQKIKREGGANDG